MSNSEREMPKPRYLVEVSDKKWIGIETYSLNGEIKKFLWWKNLTTNTGSEELLRYHAAALIARLKLEMGADAAIGPAIDLSKSTPETDDIHLIEESDMVGVYIEADRRLGFNLMVTMDGLKSEAELRLENPVKFDEMFQKAKAVLPRLTK